MEFTDKDILFMKRALKLAEKARGMTSPNPMVGAVIVKNGRIIAEDYHKKPGELHAEALAIQKAGKGAAGAALYVTLEPCCHLDKRTPPCTNAIINSGIKKVFVAMKDPNPKVSGKGMNKLKNNGIEIISGLLRDKAEKLNEVYAKYITTKIPFVTLKIAMTMDGKIATPEGQSKWITGEKARKVVHRMRSSSDAILTAIGTIKADDPELTARIRGGKNPVRVVLDPGLEIPLDSRILNTPPKTIIITDGSSKSKSQKIRELSDNGIQVIEYSSKRIDLKWLLKMLGDMGISSVMIEGGASLNSYALQDEVVDKIVFFVAPKVIGGKNSIPAVGGKKFQRLENAFKIVNVNLTKVGDDLMIEGYVDHQERRP